MKSIMFTGVKGVGKSTLAAAVAAATNTPNCDYADYMLEVMGSSDKDTIESLSLGEREAVIARVRELMERRFTAANSSNVFILLENHLTVLQEGAIRFPPPDIYWRFNLAGICVVCSDATAIVERRSLDRSRRRPAEPTALIQAQQEENERQARTVAKIYSVPLIFLHNTQGHLPVSVASEWVRAITSSSTKE